MLSSSDEVDGRTLSGKKMCSGSVAGIWLVSKVTACIVDGVVVVGGEFSRLAIQLKVS